MAATPSGDVARDAAQSRDSEKRQIDAPKQQQKHKSRPVASHRRKKSIRTRMKPHGEMRCRRLAVVVPWQSDQVAVWQRRFRGNHMGVDRCAAALRRCGTRLQRAAAMPFQDSQPISARQESARNEARHTQPAGIRHLAAGPKAATVWHVATPPILIVSVDCVTADQVRSIQCQPGMKQSVDNLIILEQCQCKCPYKTVQVWTEGSAPVVSFPLFRGQVVPRRLQLALCVGVCVSHLDDVVQQIQLPPWFMFCLNIQLHPDWAACSRMHACPCTMQSSRSDR